MHRSKLYLTIILIFFTVTGYPQGTPKVARGNIDSNLNEGIVSKIGELSRTDLTDIHLKSVVTKEQISGLEIISGRIFLTGPGFPNVIMIEANCTRDISKFKYVNGSKVVFDNCIFRNKDQSLTQPFSKAYIVTMEETKSMPPRKRI